MLKDFRRFLIIICCITLFPWFVNIISLKYEYAWNFEFPKLKKDSDIKILRPNKLGKIDDDVFILRKITTTDEASYLGYTVKRNEVGWSFPVGAIKIFDDKNREYESHSSGSSIRAWGQKGTIEIDRIKDDAKILTIKLEIYDRKMTMSIPIDEVGAENEKK